MTTGTKTMTMLLESLGNLGWGTFWSNGQNDICWTSFDGPIDDTACDDFDDEQYRVHGAHPDGLRLTQDDRDIITHAVGAILCEDSNGVLTSAWYSAAEQWESAMMDLNDATPNRD